MRGQRPSTQTAEVRFAPGDPPDPTVRCYSVAELPPEDQARLHVYTVTDPALVASLRERVASQTIAAESGLSLDAIQGLRKRAYRRRTVTAHANPQDEAVHAALRRGESCAAIAARLGLSVQRVAGMKARMRHDAQKGDADHG